MTHATLIFGTRLDNYATAGYYVGMNTHGRYSTTIGPKDGPPPEWDERTYDVYDDDGQPEDEGDFLARKRTIGERIAYARQNRRTRKNLRKLLGRRRVRIFRR